MDVRMTTNAAWIKVDPEHVADALRQEAVEKVNGGESNVILDFSSVVRIDGNAVRAMEELAGLADARSAAVVLRAVNVDIYRVLKQLGLAQRFSFDSE
jgi:anti-anti-sigma regulatory factor